MGRNRGFDEGVVVDQSIARFLTTGYEGTSVDDLVAATGLHRGSLYKAFGSKRGLFISAMKRIQNREAIENSDTDLLLVALLELAPVDREVRELSHRILSRQPNSDLAQMLGNRLLERAGITLRSQDTDNPKRKL